MAKGESNQELYKRVKDKRYETFKHIAMEIKIADEVIQEIGVRPTNPIGQQTAAATVVIRAHKLVDASKSATETAENLVEISNQQAKENVANG
jgi:hypothetical protein